MHGFLNANGREEAQMERGLNRQDAKFAKYEEGFFHRNGLAFIRG